MRRRNVTVALALIAHALLAGAADTRHSLESGRVAIPTNVTLRDNLGRAERFVDARNREFLVRYDSTHRVVGVESAKAPNVLDIESISYSSADQLLSIRYRVGYTLYFDHRSNGVQVVRDTNGAGILRTERSYQPIGQASAEQNAQLAELVTELEGLLGMLKSPSSR